MKKFSIRALAWLVAIFMVAMMMPINVLAADTDAELDDTAIDTAEELKTAIQTAQSGDTIYVSGSITLDETVAIERSLTIKGNAMIASTVKKAFEIKNADDSNMTVTFEGLTITNTAANGRCIDTRNDSITLNLVNCNLTATGSGNPQPLTIGGTDTAKSNTVTVSGGSIEAGTSGYGIITFVPVDLTLDGGAKVGGFGALYIKAGSAGSVVHVEQATLSSLNVHNGESNSFGTVVLEENNITVNIGADATVTAEATGDQAQLVLGLSKNVTFKDGENEIGISVNVDSENTTVTEALKAEGYEIQDNGSVSVPHSADAVAKVGVTYYATLVEALNACTKWETVYLLQNITYTDEDAEDAIGGATGYGKYSNPSIIYFGGTKEGEASTVNVVLDLNGHTVTNNADAYLFLPMDNSKLTLKDSVGTGAVVGNTANPLIWCVGMETLVTIESGTFTTVHTELVWVTHGGDMVINGGTFQQVDENGDYVDAPMMMVINGNLSTNAPYFIDGSTSLVINGGNFYGFDPYKVIKETKDDGLDMVDCVSPDSTVAKNEDGTYTVIDGTDGEAYVVVDGANKYFATLEDAFAYVDAIVGGQMIYLQKDVTLEETIVSNSFSDSINGGGYTITYVGSGAALQFNDTMNNLTNLTVDVTEAEKGACAIELTNGNANGNIFSTLTVNAGDNVAFKLTGNATTVKMYDSSISAATLVVSDAANAVLSVGNTTVTCVANEENIAAVQVLGGQFKLNNLNGWKLSFTVEGQNVVYVLNGDDYADVIDFEKQEGYLEDMSGLELVYDAENYAKYVAGATFAGTSLGLKNSITVNFYLHNSEILNGDCYAVISLYDGETYVSEQKVTFADWKLINGMYRISYEGVSAKQMTNRFTVQVFFADGTPASVARLDSIRDYSVRMFENEDASDELKTLLIDMLNYGAAAQKYAKYHDADEDLANYGMDAYQIYATKDEAVTYTNGMSAIPSEYYVGANLRLLNEPLMTLYFKNIESVDSVTVTYTDSFGNKVTLDANSGLTVEYRDALGYWAVSIDGLNIADVRATLTCTVTSAETEITVVDSVESYVARAITDLDQNNTDLYLSVLKYGDSAKAYFAPADAE